MNPFARRLATLRRQDDSQRLERRRSPNKRPRSVRVKTAQQLYQAHVKHRRELELVYLDYLGMVRDRGQQ